MKIIVCGDRNWDDQDLMCSKLEYLHRKYKISLLIHGDARGADKMAGEWGKSRRIKVVPFPADWEVLGRCAGPVRNLKMLNFLCIQPGPKMVIAFHKNIRKSKGTKDMLKATWKVMDEVQWLDWQLYPANRSFGPRKSHDFS